MKTLLLIIAFGFSASAFASPFDTCQKESPKWFECEKDQDCVVISDPCGTPTAAANKNFSKKAEACNIHAGATIGCLSGNAEKSQALCKNRICVAEKISKK